MTRRRDKRNSHRGALAVTTGLSAGCAGIDTAVAYGIATIAGVAMPAKLTIAGVTLGVSFAVSFMALCLCRAAGEADGFFESLVLMEDGSLD